jgi:hypothetical protein
MTEPRTGLIVEAASTVPKAGRLGRHIQFDERSKGFRIARPKAARALRTKTWTRRKWAFDQGDLGCCVGVSAVGVLATAPFVKTGGVYDLGLAKRIYTEASKVDAIPGDWPPVDTGSTILAGMQAMRKMGLIARYDWCFGMADMLDTLSYIGSVQIGTNWYAGFDEPDATGRVRATGAIRGGHAYQVIGIDVSKKLLWAVNSWGPSWGIKGRFCFSWDDCEKLLAEDGEASTVIMSP